MRLDPLRVLAIGYVKCFQLIILTFYSNSISLKRTPRGG